MKQEISRLSVKGMKNDRSFNAIRLGLVHDNSTQRICNAAYLS